MDGHQKQIIEQRQRGFTIVELLIVIIVIAILAAIVIVAYNGITTRAQNSKREDDLVTVQKGLEMYYADNGRYPAVTGTGNPQPNTCLSSQFWNCWNASATNRVLPQQYLSTVPQDPAYLDSAACSYPNSYQSRQYAYQTDNAGDGYILAAYIPGLSTSDPHYVSPQNMWCLSFANYLIRYNM